MSLPTEQSVVQSIEQRVENLIDSVFDNTLIGNAFSNISVKRPGQTLQDRCIDGVKEFWSTLENEPKETRDLALRLLVQHLHKQWNEKRADAICASLDALVENNIVEAKSVCDALLTCDKLTVNEELHWVATFKLARKIIGGVDYKGVRDLLKIVLEKCQLLNNAHNIACLPLIKVVITLVKYIINRNSCLMPAYLAIYEISKFEADKNQLWPHWPLGKVLFDFVDGFRHCAQMVSISGRHQLLPIVGHSMSSSNVWRLNRNTLRFALNGPLPYNRELQEPQNNLLRYVLEQPYSRELVCNMLELNIQAKQLCEVLEQQLVDLLVLALERFEQETSGHSQLQWQHLSSQLIYFVLFQFASFSHIVLSLYEKLKGKNLKKGRHHLMWVLLQFISGSIQKNPASLFNFINKNIDDFLPVMKLYDLLYDDKEAIPVPDINLPQSTHVMAATCIWIHLNKKAGNIKLRPIPVSLRDHLEFLKQNLKSLTLQGYRIALMCNAYSTDTDNFSRPMGFLVETIYGNNKNTTILPGGVAASAPTTPLQMNFLDSLTVHAKMSLIHSIVTRVIKLAKNKSALALAPSLVETYSRLLVYMEIESLGIKGFINQLLPTVVENQALGILHTLLEMFSYRLHHTQINYRIQLLAHLHQMSSNQPINQNQLYQCVESTILKLIIGLGSSEVQPQLSRISSEAKGGASFLVSDSEELNRALVLTIARAMHVTAVDNMSSVWCEDILNVVMQKTPISWSSNTLACFPQSLAEYFQKNNINNKDNKNQLRTSVENEYRKWKSMGGNESSIISHFSMQSNPPLFLCIIWKTIQDENRVPATAYKVLDKLGPRALTTHLRTLADYLVYEIASSPALQNSSKCIEALTDMIWKYNIIPIDRIVLCLALRSLEGKEAQVQFVVIQFLLTAKPDFKARIHDFIKENTSEHWSQSNWHDIHMNFHKKYPEKFYYEGTQDLNNTLQHQYLPVYFGNVCLRFIPVLDILIHRFLEMVVMQKAVEIILDQIGGLYKFHDHPITYLYNTLFYYEKRLADKHVLKRKLVNAIIGAFNDIRPENWCLSDDYLSYLKKSQDESGWTPDHEYYIKLINRLRSTILGELPPPYPSADWRFNEFPNASAHALHSICVELMALPISAQSVGEALIDVSLKPSSLLPPQKDMMSWYNAVGLILTALPESYWSVLNDRILKAITSPMLESPAAHHSPFKILNVSLSHLQNAEHQCSTILELCQGVWHHAGIGQLSHLPQFVKEKLKPVIKHENQFIFLCHLIGPFLQRFHMERTRCLLELTVELYDILLNVDSKSEHLYHMDAICDYLYHIKYMFVGDGVRSEVEKVICKLRPALKVRLRFISHLNIDETTAVVPPTTSTPSISGPSQ
ncbi:mediator of RNA polymerase II transcription subunit 23-like isoform X2 [Biomphalaria pfeifferi]|uniref:Mediator of RNA polymerase II transcription subunit 23 n=1 Tax=Biomphalaria pfeifferi TaxID=112525 RepID=A0AAD8BR27_BIOPF|nr:mediator of RNA polymerase II transcription subunit 23-like isoform X2 [Biomphalaria pfeifferi]